MRGQVRSIVTRASLGGERNNLAMGVLGSRECDGKRIGELDTIPSN